MVYYFDIYLAIIWIFCLCNQAFLSVLYEIFMVDWQSSLMVVYGSACNCNLVSCYKLDILNEWMNSKINNLDILNKCEWIRKAIKCYKERRMVICCIKSWCASLRLDHLCLKKRKNNWWLVGVCMLVYYMLVDGITCMISCISVGTIGPSAGFPPQTCQFFTGWLLKYFLWLTVNNVLIL